MIDEIKKFFLTESYFPETINNINNHYVNQKEFKAVDLLPQNNFYYRYMTKGILKTLLALKYVEIVGTYHGQHNYIYRVQKEVEIDFK